MAAEASGSFVAGGAKEPLLSDNVPWLWPPDVEDVPLPKTSKRMRAEDSEKTVWDPLELHRWHGERQKTESSAVADKESSAVADGVVRSGGQVVDKGRTLGLEVVDCMFLVERKEEEEEEEEDEEEEEEESSQSTTLHFVSLAKGSYVCLGCTSCECFDCP